MREILFRGKLSVNNGTLHKNDWVYGDYVRLYDGDKITKHFIYGFGEIDIKTIGQFTGLTDKNGKKIFEGDILEFEFEDIGKQKAIVYWNDAYAGLLLKPIGNFQFARICDGIVIGNIWDTPELQNTDRRITE